MPYAKCRWVAIANVRGRQVLQMMLTDVQRRGIGRRLIVGTGCSHVRLALRQLAEMLADSPAL
jgi:hypothetical protein